MGLLHELNATLDDHPVVVGTDTTALEVVALINKKSFYRLLNLDHRIESADVRAWSLVESSEKY